MPYFQVHEVQVAAAGIVPDPTPISLNDVVVWTFKGLRHHNVVEVATVDQLFDAQFNSPNCQPRYSLFYSAQIGAKTFKSMKKG